MAPTIPEQLYHLALEAPDREVLRLLYTEQDDVVLTRMGLFQSAQEVSERLKASGVQAGDLVIIVQRDSLALASTFFGAALLGAIPSILPFATEKLQPERYRASMAALIENSKPRVLAVDALVEEDVRALLPEGTTTPVLLVIEPSVPTGEGAALNGSFDPDATALLQHSSGTTGLQKGVALAHRAIFDQLEAYRRSIGFTQDDVVVSWLPLYHDMGLIAGFLMPLLTGARLVLMSPFEWVRAPAMLMQAITRHGGTLCWLPNFAYNFCAQKIRDRDLEEVDLSRVRAFINCSEPVYDSSHKMFAERFAPYGADLNKLSACYAMAETVFAISQTPVGQPARVDQVERAALRVDGLAIPANPGENGVEYMVSSGPPIDGMEIRVFDAERNFLPERQSGEIAVRSPYMMTEYYHREDATADAFYDGWYLTGDIGYLAEGEVFVMGRKKDLIIVGGRNIYPRDLEMLISTSVEGVHPGRVAAFGVPNPRAGTEDVAIVAEVDIEDAEAKRAIVNDIRRVVANGSDVAARYIELVERGWLIKTSSGKVARKANREKLLEKLNHNKPG